MRHNKNESKTEIVLAYILGGFIISAFLYIMLMATGVL